jgi:hypothetical protein
MAELLKYFPHTVIPLIMAISYCYVSKVMSRLLASIAVMMIRIGIQNIIGAEVP